MDVFDLDDIGPPPVVSTVATSPDVAGSELGFDAASSDFGMSLFDSSPPERKPFFAEPPSDVVYTTLPPYPGTEGEPTAGVTPVVGGLLTTTSPAVLGNGLGSSPPAVTASLPTNGSSLAIAPQTSVTIVFEHNNSNPVPESTTPSKKYNSGKNMGIAKSMSDQSFAPADSNSTTPAKSFVPCKVCGDKASGYHYGVTSCEGCKGFFRRSIQKQIEYRCLRDGRCLVIRLNRNRCQYCRFKKCLAVGMSRDSVRYGRVPKRSRERNEEARVTQAEADQSAREIENKQLAMYDIILTISHAHHTNCAYTEEKTRGLVRKPAIFSLDDYQSSTVDSSCSGPVTADSLEHQKIVMWQHFAVLLTPSIQRVVEFAKRVPGFLDLTQDDQLILIKLGFFEIWLVHISRMISSIDNTVTFSDGSYITHQQMELMFDHDFVSALFNFAVTFNNLQLNDTEIGLFCAAVLLTSERTGIYDNKTIDQHQEKLTEALKLQVNRNHPSEPHIFSNLMVKLPELRSLGTKHMEHLQWFRANWTRLRLPPLFAEIFDIPKPEESVSQQ